MAVERVLEPTLTPRVQVGADEWVEYQLHYITEAWQVPFVVEWMRRQKLYLLDIETDGKSSAGLDWSSERIATIQIGNPMAEDGARAFVLCVRSLGDAILPVIDELNNPGPMKLGQNIGFECRFLMWKYRRQKLKLRNLADTQIMEQTLRAGLFPKAESSSGDPDEGSRKAYSETSMAKLALLHLDGLVLEKGEDVRLTFWVTPAGQLTERHLVYAAGDVMYPYYIAKKQHKDIRARRLSDIIKIEFELIPILAWTELRGVPIDVDGWKQLWQEAIVRKAAAKQKLDEIFRPQSGQSELFAKNVHEQLTGEFDPTTGDPVVARVEEDTRPNDGKKELNYDAPAQVKEAFKQYCRRIRWPVEIVTTLPRLRQLKMAWGGDWLAKRPGKKVDDIPEWFIPEDKAVVFLKFEGDQLRLAKLRGQLPRDLVETYLEYKEAAKLAGTYGMKFLNEQVKDGLIHITFHQLTTTTGRLAAVPNTQNWPRLSRYRACLKPHPGCKFIIRDYSAIEPRLSAETSGDPVYVRTFLENLDIYCTVGEAMTGRPISKKKDPELRQGFKSVVLGSAYNMGARKLRDDLTLKLEEFIEKGAVELPTFEFARDQLKKFFASCAGIKTYQNQCIAYAAQTEAQFPTDADGRPLELPTRPKIWDEYMAFRFPNNPEMALVTYVEAPCGRKRWFPADAKNVYTEAPNAPIQGCSATITKLAACLIQRRADEMGIDIAFVNYVHDELVVEVPEAVADDFSLVVKELMEEAGRRYIKTVPVIAEAPAGNGVFDYWYKEG